MTAGATNSSFERAMADLVDSMFPRSLREAVRAELTRYPENGREPERVRQAILVLSGGSLEQVKYYVETALEDYRDVLLWAEYPDESREPD